ncbi:MAG: ATP-binding protein [Phycisphaeraceae bacterium]|nr:ATP-binding protein [Phycisphaeraceae bacterium]
MSLLDSLITTTTPAPPKMIVYGQPGVGKTTFAASAGAILIDCENGSGAVPGLRRTPYLQSWPEMRAWLAEIASTPPEGVAAVAIDTIDWMIQRIVEHVVVDLDDKSPSDITNTLGTAHGGYFKAREIVQNIVYRDVLPMLNAVANSGLAVILLAHAANTKMTTPEGFDLRLAAPDLPHWIAAPFIEWADAVLYAAREGERRFLRTEGTNVVLAKNRYSLPVELPLSWPALMHALTHSITPDKEN